MEPVKVLIKEMNETKCICYRSIITKVLIGYFFKGLLLRKVTWKITFKGKYLISPFSWIFKSIRYYIKLIIANIFKMLGYISSKILPKNSRLSKRMSSYIDRKLFTYIEPHPEIYRYSPTIDENYLEYILETSGLKLLNANDLLLEGKIIYTITKNY